MPTKAFDDAKGKIAGGNGNESEMEPPSLVGKEPRK